MAEEHTNLMTEGDLKKKIIFFAIPILIGNLFQQLYNTADSLITGNFLGAQALAAVTGVGSLVALFTGFFTGFSTGAGVVIARSIGRSNKEQINAGVHTAAAVGIVLSILITLVGVFVSPSILVLMGTPDDVMDLSVTYLRIYFMGSAGLVMYNIFTGILEAAGDSRHPLIYLILSSLINIVLDIVFITVFHMGVGGAAFATIISEILTAVLAGRRLIVTKDDVQLHLNQIRFDHDSLIQILRYGFPTALQGCVIDLSNILIQSYINSFGSLAMAGIGASSKVEGFGFLPITSFSLAMTTFISQNMGARKYDRVKEGMHFCFKVSLIMIEVIGVVLFVFAPQIIALFNHDPQVIAYGTGRERVCALFYFLVAYSHIASGACRGLGRPMVPMVVMLVCWCAVRIAILFTIGRTLHVVSICYWVYPITWTISAVVFFFYLKHVTKNLEMM